MLPGQNDPRSTGVRALSLHPSPEEIRRSVVVRDGIGELEAGSAAFTGTGATGAEWSQPGLQVSLPPSSPSGHRFMRGAMVLGGLSIAAVGVLAALPGDVTQWDGSFVTEAKDHLKRAWREPPVWDEDTFFLNYVGHPYAGSIYYNTIRSQGGSVFESFLFGLFASTTFEYVFEAVAEQPSIQDLVVTPLVGSLLGEGFHQLTMLLVAGGVTVPEGIILTIINPIHVVMNGFR